MSVPFGKKQYKKYVNIYIVEARKVFWVCPPPKKKYNSRPLKGPGLLKEEREGEIERQTERERQRERFVPVVLDVVGGHGRVGHPGYNRSIQILILFYIVTM